MIPPPTFASLQEHLSRLGDIDFWQPYIAEILERHHLKDLGWQTAAGFNPTYPIFLHGDVVVKLFGYSRSWRASHAAERAAYAVLATDPGSVPDFKAFCESTGNILVEHSEQAGVYRFVIQHI
jgi:hypothetical protein